MKLKIIGRDYMHRLRDLERVGHLAIINGVSLRQITLNIN
jgi:hypothetical protein